jgi:hypothetical protein
MNPIADYLAELAPALRRRSRRRILAEVHAHLLESAACHRARGIEPARAERLAVARFGSPLRVAAQFNALRRRPGALLSRAAAVTLAAAGMASVGTATVWAIVPGSGQTHVHQDHLPYARHPGGRP